MTEPLLFSSAFVIIFNAVVLNMEYREATADIEADQEPRQELGGSVSFCSTSNNDVRSFSIQQRGDVSEAKVTGSIASSYYLWPETYEKPLKSSTEVYPRSERLGGAPQYDTQPVLRCSAFIAIWIKNKFSVITQTASKALHGLHSAVIALWIKRNSFVVSQTTLKALHACFLNGDEIFGATRLPQRPLDEVSDLIDTCRSLRAHDNTGSTMRQALTRNRLLHRHTEEMALDLQEKARILLSLLAWHFDPKMASVSHGLFRFFDQPHEQLGAVCKKIYPIYSKLHEVENEECLEKDLNRLMKLLRRAVVSELWTLCI